MFVHGNPGSGEDWTRARCEQAGGFARAVAPDMPGFGRADKPRDFPYSVAGYADFLDGLLERARHRPRAPRAARLRRALGPGMGGAATRTRVRSVALINTGALDRLPVAHPGPHMAHARAGRGVPGDGHPPAVPVADEPGPEAQAAARASWTRMYDVNFTRPTRRAVLKLYRATSRSRRRRATARPRRLRPHDIPRSSSGARATPTSASKLAHAQQEAFPTRAGRHVFEDSGHWPFADDPERTAARVSRSCASRPPLPSRKENLR